jgi:xanthine dehydrogenase YagS FAD-binding subunit
VKEARIALGGIGTVPWRSTDAEAVLTGSELSKETIKKAAEAALAGAETFQFNAYKVPLAKLTLERALREIGGVA